MPVNPQIQTILTQAEEKMKKALDRMRSEFSTVRTGRASVTLLDHIRVEYYGAHTPLKQMAAVSVPDGRTLEVKPWDASTLQAIERAIHASDLGLTPQNDGKLIRLSIPSLTEERRKDLARTVKKMSEDFRVSIRNDRREAMEKIKKAEKDKIISEDERKNAEDLLQKQTDLYVKRVDEGTANKEKELMEV